MESNKQEKYNLLHDNPVAKHASGSWMSKHSQQSRLGGSPLHVVPPSESNKKKEIDATRYTEHLQNTPGIMKANPAEKSSKLRELPEVESNEVEVTISPDGQQVKAYK